MTGNRSRAERAAALAAMLDAVESLRPVVSAHVDDHEQRRTLAPAVVDALDRSGLFGMKIPAELGGAEAHPIDQMEVIDALTRIDPATGWCMFISSAVAGNATSRLADEAIEVLYANGRHPRMAGTLKPDGSARRVAGGYVASGRWSWASGIHHADFVSALVRCEDEATVIASIIPADEVTIHDNWHTVGMRGTGSCDYSLDEVFVPDAFATDMARIVQRRGGNLYRMGLPGYVVNEHAVFALTLARMVLESVVELVADTSRGYGQASPVAQREVVQREIARSSLRLDACRRQMDDVLDRLFDASADGPPPARLSAESRAMATLCTDEALDVSSTLFRYAGGRAIQADHPLQRVLRDLYTAQSHLMVSDSAYEAYGQLLLGLSDQGPLR